MPPRPNQYFCVHSHFYQPPRGNPITGDIGEEADAEKYRNWNVRITAESYRPNAEIGNFDRISFNVGESLLAWLKKRAPETYSRIIAADRPVNQKKRVGNAIASSYHDVLLPLRRRQDKHTELYWGKMAFRHHFGRDPQGIWLPEMAVDPDTLHVVDALGYKFTILAGGQVQGADDGAGPYWIDLGTQRRIATFVRHDELSNDLSFNISTVGGAGHWARHKLAGRRLSKGALTLVATNGETFGHHHLGEERFLHWLLKHEAPAIGYKITTLNEYMGIQPPIGYITVTPFSSWSDQFRITHWITGHEGWKASLLRALDHLAAEMFDVIREEVRPLNTDPLRLREEYIRVRLGEMTGTAFLAECAPGLSSDEEARYLDLLKAWVYMSKAYTGNAFYKNEFDAPPVRYAIGTAIHAMAILHGGTGVDLSAGFRNDLAPIRREGEGRDGTALYDAVYEEFFAPPEDVPVVAV
ncbi:MAG TPA: DUF3536 domain-containing protein [Aggregatilineales bacterium]|nr:DUF3536 domain-containing protein [Anaerolineales bacterium]HRE48950.1 DUF3536 domain-containing protein [Aggregatilineales bacterium]